MTSKQMALRKFARGLGEHAHNILFRQMVRAGLVACLTDEEFETVTKDLAKELKRIGDEVKDMAGKAIAEAKKSSGLSEDTKGKVDELLVKQGELQARLREAEQKLDARSPGGKGDEDGQASPGRAVIESKAFKEWHEAGANAKKGVSIQMKTVTSLPASAGDGIEPQRLPGIVSIPERRMTVRDLITPGRTGSNLVQYVRETGFTNNAATVAETTKKPESDLVFDLLQAPVVKIAHYVKASSEILADFAQLQSYIDGRLRYGLAYVEETQLLKGSGVGNNLNGIYTQATAYAAPIAIVGATAIDVLRLALLQAELAEYPSTGIVLHPSNWAAIELQKDSTGAYIFANPQSLAQPALWGRPVVGTQAMTINTFLTGAFRLGAQVWDRQQAAVVIATENEDDFVKNLVTILAEERLALTVYRPEAFIKGPFA
jgi:HK97 family phage major capsid protein